MVNRHLSRSIVLQSLYEWDFGDKSAEEGKRVLERNIEEFVPGKGDYMFITELFDGILEKQKDIDAIIEKAAPDWPLDKIAIVDRNILRLGLYELLFGDRSEVPPKVAINEAIELAKSFGGETSSRFVNGVLGAVYKEMGEPGKEETSRKSTQGSGKEEDLPVKTLCGAVVYAWHKDTLYLGFVHDIFGHWTLTKGRINEGEGQEEGVRREVKEEMGLEVEVEEKLGENSYVASDPEQGKIKKNVTYYLAKAPYGKIAQPESGGLDDARWFPAREVTDLNFYDDIVPIVTRAVSTLLEQEAPAGNTASAKNKQKNKQEKEDET